METVQRPDGVNQKSRVPRREFLRLGAIGGAAVAAGAVASTWMPDLRKRGLLSAEGVFDAGSIAWADVLYLESFPTSPLILNPFTDQLPVPKALVPEPYVTGRTGGPSAGARGWSAELDAVTSATSGGAVTPGPRTQWCTRSS